MIITIKTNNETETFKLRSRLLDFQYKHSEYSVFS